MSQTQDTIVAALMEQLIAEGPDGMAQVFTTLFNLAMRLERERFLGAGLYERNPDRRGYANGYKSKTLDTTAGTVTVDVPKAAGIDEPFYPQSLERGRRSSCAVMLAIAEMYVQGVSTRDAAKVMAEFGLKACRRPRSAGPPRSWTRNSLLGAAGRWARSTISCSMPATRSCARAAWSAMPPCSPPSASGRTGDGACSASLAIPRKPKSTGEPSSTT